MKALLEVVELKVMDVITTSNDNCSDEVKDDEEDM